VQEQSLAAPAQVYFIFEENMVSMICIPAPGKEGIEKGKTLLLEAVYLFEQLLIFHIGK
jgi:hypothetical protein